MNKVIKLLISFFVMFATGLIGYFVTINPVKIWYPTLNKSFLNPPSFVFAPAWTILYIIIGVSLFLILINETKNKNKALIIFSIQIILNILWSVAFFGLQNPLLAMFVIVLLFISIILNILEFYKINKISGLILIPYLLWVLFASTLNYSVIVLN